MDAHKHRVIATAAAVAILMSTFAATVSNAKQAQERRPGADGKKVGAGTVTASGVQSALYGITVSDAATALKKYKPAIEKSSIETSKDFGAMFAFSDDMAAKIFGALGATIGMAEAVRDGAGITQGNSGKTLVGWRFLPSVAALILEQNKKTDVAVSDILDGRYTVERFGEVFTAKKIDIDNYTASLGYLAYVFVEPDLIGKMIHAFGLKADESAIADLFVKNAKDNGGYVMMGGDNKPYVSLGYGFAVLLAAFQDATVIE